MLRRDMVQNLGGRDWTNEEQDDKQKDRLRVGGEKQLRRQQSDYRTAELAK